MTEPRRAVVVGPTPGVSQRVAEWLERAGYSTLILAEFGPARAELDAQRPDLVVAEVKLGPYNGLHLAVRIRSREWQIPVLLVGDPDPVLEAEAEKLQAPYLRMPPDEATLLSAIASMQAGYRSSRRSPRKRVLLLEALIDDVPARIVDVSYDGLRLELLHPLAIPSQFKIWIPMFNVSCCAQRIWTSPSQAHEATACGATLVGTDPAAIVAWRALVDSVPGWSLLAL